MQTRHTALTCKKRPISGTSRQAGGEAELSSQAPAGREAAPPNANVIALRQPSHHDPDDTNKHH
jgi:hypothetical protein